MENSKLINDFLEGTIDKSGENQLFNTLASNEELRNDLRQTIEIDRAMSKRISAFVPTSHSTMSIFNQLGIATTAAVTTGVAVTGFKALMTGFLTKYTAAIVSSLLTLAVTSGAFIAYNYSKEKVNDKNNLQNTSLNKQAQQPDIPKISSSENAPNIISETDATANKQSPPVKTIIKYVYLEKKHDDIRNITEVIPENPVIKNEEPKIIDITVPNNTSHSLAYSSIDIPKNKMEINNTIMPSGIDKNIYKPYTFSEHKDLGLSLEIIGNSYLSLPNSTVPKYSDPAFNNMKIGLLYSVSQDWSIGLEIRRENFYQVYTGHNNLGNEFQYKQNPTYFSSSFVGKWDFMKYNWMNMFAQLGLGGTETGYIIRPMLGLKFLPNSSYSFIIGPDYSFFYYQHDGHWFNSNKLSLYYGVSFNF